MHCLLKTKGRFNCFGIISLFIVCACAERMLSFDIEVKMIGKFQGFLELDINQQFIWNFRKVQDTKLHIFRYFEKGLFDFLFSVHFENFPESCLPLT